MDTKAIIEQVKQRDKEQAAKRKANIYPASNNCVWLGTSANVLNLIREQGAIKK